MPMMGSGGGTATSGESFEQLLKLLQDPEAFADRKAMLDAMRVDLNKILEDNDRRRLQAEERERVANKAEAANNFVKMANDKRMIELQAYEVTLRETAQAMAANQATTDASLAQKAAQVAADEKAAHERLNAKQAMVGDMTNQLEIKKMELAAATAAHAQDKADHAAKLEAAKTDIVERELLLKAAIEDFNKGKTSVEDDLKLKQQEFESLLADHTKKVNNIRALIDQLFAALN